MRKMTLERSSPPSVVGRGRRAWRLKSGRRFGCGGVDYAGPTGQGGRQGVPLAGGWGEEGSESSDRCGHAEKDLGPDVDTQARIEWISEGKTKYGDSSLRSMTILEWEQGNS